MQEVTPNGNQQVPAPGSLGRGSTILSEYMTPQELAEELGICKRTLDRWHASRSGPPRLTVGRKPFYRRSSVEAWLLGRERNFEERKGAGPRRGASR